MSGHVGHHLRLSASRVRPRTHPLTTTRKCLLPEPHHHLAPKIRLHTPGQRRHFSLADGAGVLLRGSELLITNIHTLTGGPWFLTIPLAAVAVGAVLRLPLTVYTHGVARRRAALVPLIQAHAAMVGRGLRGRTVPGLRTRMGDLVRARTSALSRAFALGESRSIVASVLSLPVFLSNLEVIRRMCGGSKGLLGNLVFASAGTEKAGGAVPASSASVEVGGPSPTTADLVGGDFAAPAPVIQDALGAIAVEPTFATGGCLWFPSLLEADPYHILPFAVSTVLVAGMIPSSPEMRRDLFGMRPAGGGKRAVQQSQSPGRRAFQRALLLLSFSIGPLTMDMPAAIHLYWLSSATFSLAVMKGIRILRPLPKHTIKPCKGYEVPLLRPKAT